MRMITTIDFININNFSVLNSANASDQLMIYILPAENQKTNLKVEITGSNGQIFTSDVLIIEQGESATFVDYDIPKTYWTDVGTMKVRLLSDEGNSEYVNFNIPEAITRECQARYADGTFSIELLTISEPSDLPIASETRLGGIKVGENLEIEADGTLNSIGIQGPPGKDGKTPQMMINSDGHLIAIYDD